MFQPCFKYLTSFLKGHLPYYDYDRPTEVYDIFYPFLFCRLLNVLRRNLGFMEKKQL